MIQRDLGDGTYASYDEPVPPPVPTRHPRARCTNPEHRDGEHSAACLPPADPGNPELRLIRAIWGLCSICDRTDDHEHTDAEYRAACMIPPARDEEN